MKSLNSFFAALLFVAVSSAVAETTPNYDEQCSNLVKECFASAQVDQSNCLFSASQHPFCEGTDLGKLSYQRWSMSPNKPGGIESAPAFLGPQLVDGECLKNFDSQWSSMLVRGEISTKQVAELTERLQGCARDISNELMRP